MIKNEDAKNGDGLQRLRIPKAFRVGKSKKIMACKTMMRFILWDCSEVENSCLVEKSKKLVAWNSEKFSCRSFFFQHLISGSDHENVGGISCSEIAV